MRTLKPAVQLTKKGQLTKARIINAARTVFERDGFVDTRVSDITKAARVAHGTFYIYFTSKEDIFRAVIMAHQQAIDDARRATSGERLTIAAETIEAANRSYIESWAEHYRLMLAWGVAAEIHEAIARLREQEIERGIARIERSLRRMQTTGCIATDIDPCYAARALSSMLLQFCIQTFRDGPDGVDIDTAVHTVSNIWVRGIGLERVS